MAFALAPDRKNDVEVFIDRHMSGEKVMGGFKKLLVEIVVDFTSSFQKKRLEFDDKRVQEILASGAKIAQKNADNVLERVEKALSLQI